MHTRIQFYMNREVGGSFFLGCFNQSIEQVEIINFRLQLIVEHSLECCELRVHYDDRRSNTCFTKFGTFIGYGYSQIIDMMFLQCLGYFIRTGSISGSLYHADHFRFGMTKHRTIMIQVLHHCTEIYFQNRFMHFQFQFFGQQIKVEHTGTFNQNYFRMK